MGEVRELTKIIDPSVMHMPPELDEIFAQRNAQLPIIHQAPPQQFRRSHLESSHRAILAASEAALAQTPQGQETSALFIATGSCLDLPYRQVVEGFDRVTFLDINTNQTEEELRRNLPEHLLGKATLLQADITGTVADFAHTTRRLIDEELDYPDFTAAASQAIGGLELPLRPPVEGPFTFVCSHLAMSQLGAMPRLYVDSLVRERYERSLPEDTTGPEARLNSASGSGPYSYRRRIFCTCFNWWRLTAWCT